MAAATGGARWRRFRRALGASAGSDFGENLCYLLFGQSWPDNDRSTLVGWASVWLRWLFVPIGGRGRGRGRPRLYRGREWLLPLCARC